VGADGARLARSFGASVFIAEFKVPHPGRGYSTGMDRGRALRSRSGSNDFDLSEIASSATLRIVVPAKDEALRIRETIQTLSDHFGDSATVLVVANGCKDETSDIVRSFAATCPRVELLEIEAPIGKGGAIRAGLTLGREPYVAIVDADGSTHPAQIDRLLTHCRQHELSGVIGSRWLPASSITRKQPIQRRIASRAFNLLVRMLFGLSYSDTQCGAKVFERAAIDQVFDRLELANFAFDVDLLLAMRLFHCRVTEIPIEWADVPAFSKVALMRTSASMLLALLRLWVRSSVFRNLPWADLLARSSVIPVKRGLRFLLLVGGDATSPRTNALIEEIQHQGHTVDVKQLRGVLDALTFIVSYLREGHRFYDVLVDLIDSNGSIFTVFSTKPKILTASIAALDVDQFPAVVRRVAKRCGYNAFLWRLNGEWGISHNRVELLSERS